MTRLAQVESNAAAMQTGNLAENVNEYDKALKGRMGLGWYFSTYQHSGLGIIAKVFDCLSTLLHAKVAEMVEESNILLLELATENHAEKAPLCED